MRMFKYIDLFSGIGGFHEALKGIGGECVLASDTCKYANEVYFRNHNIKPLGDVRLIKSEKIPDFDLLCAGFPCQPFSQIGNKKGINDLRGQLIYEVIRILRDKKPKAFILENVPGLERIDKGETIKFIVQELENSGYRVERKILNACDYGLPQMRKRLFIVGVNTESNIEFRFPQGYQLKTNLSHILGGKTNKRIAYTIRIGGRRSGINNKFNWDAYMVDDMIRYLTPEECLELQGFPKNFELIGSKTTKYKLVGNSVPTNIVKEIAQKLIELGVIS